MLKNRALIITIALISLAIVLNGLIYMNKGYLNIVEDIDIPSVSQKSSIGYDGGQNLILVGNYDNEVIAYKNEQEIWRTKLNGVASDIAIESTNHMAYIGSEDGNIYIVDLENGITWKTINIGYRVYDIDLNTNQKKIVVSAGSSVINHKLLLFDLEGELVWKNDVGIRAETVMFDAKTSNILVGTNRAEIVIYDITGQIIETFKLDYKVEELTKRDGILTVLTDGETIYQYNDKFELIRSLTLGKGEYKGIDHLSIEGKSIISVGNAGGMIRFINDSDEAIYTVELDGSVIDIQSANGKTLVSSGKGNIATIDNKSLVNINRNTLVAKYLNLMLKINLYLVIISLFFSVKWLNRKSRKLLSILNKYKTAYLLLLPTFTLIIIFAYIPIFTAMTRAFTDWNVFSPEIHFNGLDNFKKMIEEGYFLAGLKNLLIMIFFNLLKFTTIPFLAAELVYHLKNDKAKYYSRLLFVVPMVVPMVVTALMWQNIYDPNIGLLNQLLEVVGLENLQHVWLGDSKTALGAIIFMGFPFIDAFAFLVYYGGLLNIPQELFEAAKIDGSNGFWNLLYIHIPLISPQFKIIIMLQFIATIQNFAPILILTGGGPGTSTYVPGLELYYNATVFGNYGYACALGLVMFVAIAIVTYFNSKIKTTLDD